MLCANCGTTNSEGSRFCMSCGHDLSNTLFSMLCANCGTTNSEGSRFCMSCGHDLSKVLLSPSAQPTAAEHPPAIVQQVDPRTRQSRPDEFRAGGDLLLALTGTVFGALAGIISRTLVSRDSYLFDSFALTTVVTLLTLLVSFSSIIPVAFAVFRKRAVQRKMKLNQLRQTEMSFFMSVEDDISVFLGAGGKRYAE